MQEIRVNENYEVVSDRYDPYIGITSLNIEMVDVLLLFI